METITPQDELPAILDWLRTTFIGDIAHGRQSGGELSTPHTEIHQYTRLRTVVDMLTLGGDVVPKEVWATSAPYMNDTQEFEYARSIFLDRLDRLQSRPDHRIAASVFDFLREEARQANGRNVFCACFSAKPDDLNQWRGYAEGGKGVCLSYDLHGMRQAFPTYSGWVHYDEAYQGALAGLFVRSLATGLHGIEEGGPISNLDAALLAALRGFMALVFTFFKHPKFAEEAEFRIAYLRDAQEGPVPLSFRVDGTRLLPYVRLTIEDEAGPRPLPLRKVTLAPGSKGENNVAALRRLLESRGLDTSMVAESEIPFLPTS